jgi:hypothetical protein
MIAHKLGFALILLSVSCATHRRPSSENTKRRLTCLPVTNNLLDTSNESVEAVIQSTLSRVQEDYEVAPFLANSENPFDKLILRVGEWILQGRTFEEIEAGLGVGQARISRALAILKDRYPLFARDDVIFKLPEIVAAQNQSRAAAEQIANQSKAAKQEPLFYSVPTGQASDSKKRTRRVKITLSESQVEDLKKQIEQLLPILERDFNSTTFERARGGAGGVKLDELGQPGVTKREIMVGRLLLSGMSRVQISESFGIPKPSIVRLLDALKNRYSFFLSHQRELTEWHALLGFPTVDSIKAKFKPEELAALNLE